MAAGSTTPWEIEDFHLQGGSQKPYPGQSNIFITEHSFKYIEAFQLQGGSTIPWNIEDVHLQGGTSVANLAHENLRLSSQLKIFYSC